MKSILALLLAACIGCAKPLYKERFLEYKGTADKSIRMIDHNEQLAKSNPHAAGRSSHGVYEIISLYCGTNRILTYHDTKWGTGQSLMFGEFEITELDKNKDGVFEEILISDKEMTKLPVLLHRTKEGYLIPFSESERQKAFSEYQRFIKP